MGMQTYLQLFSFLLKLHVVFKTMKLRGIISSDDFF